MYDNTIRMTKEEYEARDAARVFGKSAGHVRAFLLAQRQHLDSSIQRFFRGARYDARLRALIGKNGYRLEWRVRKDEDVSPDANNPQRPTGVAVLTSPLPSSSMSAGEGRISASPSTPPRNSPCPCGSGKKYKICHMLRVGESPEERQERERRAKEAQQRRRHREGGLEGLLTLAAVGVLAASHFPPAPRYRRRSR